MMTAEQMLIDDAARIEARLDFLTRHIDNDYPTLHESIRYSLLSGGKRIRPFLALAFCRMFDGDEAVAMDLGCALEMIHTYSLIHDDLPCMDDDDLRRGKPTNHVVFGEATATLSGDALLTEAFSVASSDAIPNALIPHAIRILSKAAGADGMIGGQMIDMRGETERLDFDTLLSMHAKKTGALIRAACLLGCLSAGITSQDDIRYQAAVTYADRIGLAFQVIDDRLDAIGDTDAIGKPVGSDAESGKTTFLTFMNVDQAYDYARDLTQLAVDAIAPFSNKEPLCALAEYLLDREK